MIQTNNTEFLSPKAFVDRISLHSTLSERRYDSNVTNSMMEEMEIDVSTEL